MHKIVGTDIKKRGNVWDREVICQMCIYIFYDSLYFTILVSCFDVTDVMFTDVSSQEKHGASNSAGEIGYLKIGGSATLEAASSVTALVKAVAAAKNIPVSSIDGKKIFRLAKSGDSIASTAIDRMIDHLSAGIANICYVLNPEKIIIGGGIMI